MLVLSATSNQVRGGEIPLVESFLAIDAVTGQPDRTAAARAAFEELSRAATKCIVGPASDAARPGCMIEGVFASNQMEVVADPGDPGASTITSVLVSSRGNCAALAALTLALAERVKIPLEAVVFAHHVVVRTSGSDEVFELLDRGQKLNSAQLRRRLGTDADRSIVVPATEFPAYYLDNLAVRFADAGDTKRADALFAKAIEAGPRVARFRFNYGTYLLGRDQLEPAREQLERAVRLDKKNASAWANLGVAQARLGDAAKARKSFERALRYEPGNRVASENLKALGLGDHEAHP